MRITKVYTKFGDKGHTSLADGTKVRKDNLRIEAYGTVDELNATLGLCMETLRDRLTLQATNKEFDFLLEFLLCIQQDLFNIGADLATPLEKRFSGMVFVSEFEISALEKAMDSMNELLPPLKDFVLPSGSMCCAVFHLARTVCRRAERRVVALSELEEINPEVIRFLNRLSDFFFVSSRYVQDVLKVPEVIWKKSGGLAHFKRES